MSHIKKIFQNKPLTIALLAFHAVFGVIVLTNFPQGKYLYGWDSLHPELNPLLNIKRAFSAMWQENYGVGTLGGHGFAATLPHSILMLLLSFLLPLWAVRPVILFLLLYAGGLGVFILLSTLLSHKEKSEESRMLVPGASLIGALFYMLNIGTVQMFYTPLEAFSALFSALPWLFLTAIKLVKYPTRSNRILFVVVNFCASVMGFIPSLFISYISLLGIFLLTHTLLSSQKTKAALRSLEVFVLTFTIHAYWLIPVAYFTLTRAGSFQQAYNNLLSTPEFVEKSTKYGSLINAALLKGFSFDSFELSQPLLGTWTTHFENPLVIFVGLLFFVLPCIGIALAVQKKTHGFLVFVPAFIYAFSQIAVSTPPFSWIYWALSSLSPVFSQAFRNTFTKGSLSLAFMYSLFLGLTTYFLMQTVYKQRKEYVHMVSGALGMLVVFLSLPAFTGNLFFNKLKIDIPDAYFSVMEYFRDKPDGRIAELPQDCPEGWYGYNWGYFGSGFYWYGIRQPFLSRTFDVWNPSNESFYWEITRAIRAEDYEAVDNVLDKYHARWVLVDPNMVSCRTNKSLFQHDKLYAHIAASEKYVLVETFASSDIVPMRIYENTSIEPGNIFTTTSVPNIGPYTQFTEQDIAYNTLDSYVTEESDNFGRYYPFQTLLLDRVSQTGLDVRETPKSIVFSVSVPQNVSEGLTIPSMEESSGSLPATLMFRNKPEGKTELIITVYAPHITTDPTEINPLATTVKTQTFETQDEYIIYVNGKEITEDAQKSTVLLHGNGKNIVDILDSDKNHVFSDTIGLMPFLKLFDEQNKQHIQNQTGTLSVIIPKQSLHPASDILSYTPVACGEPEPTNRNAFEVKSGEYIRLISQESRQCLSVHTEGIPTDQGYILSVQSKNVQGQPARLSVSNKGRPAGIQTLLHDGRALKTEFFLLPPVFPGENSITTTIQNVSFGNTPSINDIASFELISFPYDWIKGIYLGLLDIGGAKLSPVPAQHPFDSLYTIQTTDFADKTTLILMQSYAPEWIVTDWSFLTFSSIFPHFPLNSWANAWDINAGTEADTVIIFFWPQILQWLGFLILPLPIIWAVCSKQTP